MEPLLRPGDRLYVEPSGRVTLNRADVVLLDDPEAPGRLLVKRVVGLEGDRLRVTGTGVESAPFERAGAEGLDELVVPAGTAFVISDNYREGRDSRRFGPVPLERLQGVVWFRYAPVERRGPIPPTD